MCSWHTYFGIAGLRALSLFPCHQMWYFEHSRYMANKDKLIYLETAMAACTESATSLKWEFRKWLHLGNMSGYSIQFFKGLIINVPYSTAFLFIAYGHSGLCGCTPQHKGGNTHTLLLLWRDRWLHYVHIHPWSKMLVNTFLTSSGAFKGFVHVYVSTHHFPAWMKNAS